MATGAAVAAAVLLGSSVPRLGRSARAPLVTARRPMLLERLGRPVRRALGRAPDEGADRRVGGALVLVAVGAVLHPVLGAAAGTMPLVAPALHRRRARGRAAAALVDEVPDVVDLFRVAAVGGLTVHQAVREIEPLVRGPIGDALTEVRRLVQLGERLCDALDPLSRLGDPVRPLARVLASSACDGAPLREPLERVAEQARDVRRRRAEERARRAPVLLLFPLVLCVLPAFVLLTVVPLLAGAVRSLPR